jgi:sugar phosphate permease
MDREDNATTRVLYIRHAHTESDICISTAASALLKDSKRYTVVQINNYPTTTYAVQVFATLVYAWSSDSMFRGPEWLPILFTGIVNIITYVSLAVWDIPEG